MFLTFMLAARLRIVSGQLRSYARPAGKPVHIYNNWKHKKKRDMDPSATTAPADSSFGLKSPRPRSPSPKSTRSTSEKEPPAKKQRIESAGPNKRTFKANPKNRKQKRKNKDAAPEPCSPDDVLRRDIADVLGAETVETLTAGETEAAPPFEFKEELEATVSKLSSSGQFLS